MTRKLTASVLALSLVFSGVTVAPANAGNNDDVGRFIAGAITLFIIGKALEQSNRRPAVSRAPSHTPQPQRPAFNGYVPNECFFTMRTPQGRRGVYGKVCVEEVMYRPERLPAVCLDRVPVRYGRKALVYDAQCLRGRGFKDSNWHG